MGLLPPTSGAVSIDGHALATLADVRAWQANIAHVPQMIHIVDGTIAENNRFRSEARRSADAS